MQLSKQQLVEQAYDTLSRYPDEELGRYAKEYVLETIHSSFDGWPEDQIPVVEEVIADFMRWVLAHY